jgi:two-component sensor histidine kinase
VKYGALSNAAGSILIEWTIETPAGQGLLLNWKEKNGPPVTPVPVGNSLLLATDIESGDAPPLCERFVA